MPKSRTRGAQLSSRPFYTTLLLFSLFAAFSFLSQTSFKSDTAHTDPSALLKRSKHQDCRHVHSAPDQCAFVRRHCTDENAGLLPYLELYFCTLGKAKPVAFGLLVLWLGLLFTTIGIAASDFFSVNLSTIATILGLSESLAGVTFLAFGNGSPDVFSTFAAMGSNSASMAVGELIGAASFITGVVAGSMALVREFRVDKKTYARDICFFIVAVCFTVVFLADGKLRFWECWAMIGYYVIYVITVVGWHWYSKRRLARRRREGEARSLVYGIAGQSADELAGEPYRDDPEEESYADYERGQPQSGETQAGESDVLSGSDTLAFDHGPRIEIDGHEPVVDEHAEDVDVEDHERMVAAEVASSMRVLRTRSRRSHTQTPIRPSLVGALEFRSALAQLQRESNLQLASMPGYGRSRSEAHIPRRGSASVNQSDSRQSLPGQTQGRGRALSASNAPHKARGGDDGLGDGTLYSGNHIPASSGINWSAVSSHPTPETIGGHLAPPSTDSPQANSPLGDRGQPGLHLQIPSRRSSYSDASSEAASPFPRYTDSPMTLTPGGAMEPLSLPLPAAAAPTNRNTPFTELHGPRGEQQSKPIRWWPHHILPPPHVVLATLFPTLQGWREKSIWDKFVSTISVPSIFLLVITLPVVEPEADSDLPDLGTIADAISQRDLDVSAVSTPAVANGTIEGEWERYRRHTLRRGSSHNSHRSSPRLASLENEDTLVEPNASTAPAPAMSPIIAKPASDVPSVSNANDENASWNRWLVCLQLFTGPLFAVFILWANLSEDWDNPRRDLLRMILYTLLGSLILLGGLLMLTSERSRPKYHFLFCFLGFVISIAWISTIAGEVVGVLKTFGVVLGISEALLGLTIFAAGNSVGDLIADITVARLGYPVMALSACFGGPMLNILLGIGIGGVMMMIRQEGRRHQRHPDEPTTYGPYHVHVGGTLMISTITLLVALVGLLIVVPLNKWILSRRIGYGLIALWVVSTTVNVIVELTGVWGELS